MMYLLQLYGFAHFGEDAVHHGTAQCVTAWCVMVRHGVCYSAVRHGTVRCVMVLHGGERQS